MKSTPERSPPLSNDGWRVIDSHLAPRGSPAVDRHSGNAETRLFELAAAIVRNSLIALTLLGLAACKRPSPTAATSAPTPQQAPVSAAEQPQSDGYVGVPESAADSPSPSPAARTRRERRSSRAGEHGCR